MSEEIKQQLLTLQTDLTGFLAKSKEEMTSFGSVQTETKDAIAKLSTKLDAMDFSAIQKQVDAMEVKIAARIQAGDQPSVKSLGEMVVESENYKAAKELNFRGAGKQSIVVPIDNPFAGRKSIISTVGLGSGTSGIIMPQRLPGVTGLPQQELRIRDLMKVTPMTTGNAFDFVRMLTRTNGVSPQVETSPKAESTYTWETKSDTVKTIAHFTNVSRQAIEDVPWLQGMINSELIYGLLLKEESEILAGDGTGQHLKGLIPQATAYNTGLTVAADQRLDTLRHAKLQARLVGLGTFAPDGIVLHPTDMEKIELIKTEEGGANKGLYIIGDPKSGPQVKLLWGLPVVESDSIAVGTFLVGAFGTGAELIDRLAAMVEISWEHGTNFTQNLATVLCEERVGLACRRPEAFVSGSFV